MPDYISNNKRIAKNTLLLYVRMAFSLLVGLYTSRIILETLGIDDYGIYNVVGGFVSMFTLLTSSMSSAISRFLTFEIGRGDTSRLSDVFSTSVTIQIILSIIMLVIMELFGVWFLNTHMNIPSERMVAANYILQFSILSFLANLFYIPYIASIIAHERMDAYAYITVFETLLKLSICLSLYYVSFDRLIFYSALMFLSAFLIGFIYRLYCKKKFTECRYKPQIKKSLLKEMLSFAGWNFWGNGAHLFSTQGVNILSNIFFGVRINASIGIANQVQGAVQQFVNNFTQAVNPQITKSYASGDLPYMHKLICLSAKYSYFLMLLFAIPICFEAETILRLWLKVYPEYSVTFVRLTFLSSLMVVISNSMVISILATGDIKKYQIIVGMISFSTFPLTYLSYKLGCNPTAPYIIFSIVYFILIFVRLYLVKDKIKLPTSVYIYNVLFKVVIVSLLSIIIPFILVNNLPESIGRMLIICVSSVIITTLVIFLFGMNTTERYYLLNIVKKNR